VIVRPATALDVAAIAGVLEASGESVAWPGLPGWPYVEHLVARARVPLAVVDGDVIGFAGAIDLGGPRVRFLTDLFVRPDQQDRGAGGVLLGAALDGTTERMTFSSADPRALARYIRAGMRPWWPLIYLDVPRTAVVGTHTDPTLVIERSDVAATAALSRTWTGMDRTRDFAYYAGLPGGAGYVIRDASGQDVGVVWATDRRTAAGRVAVHATFGPGAVPIATGLAALVAAIGDGDRLTAHIPGPHPVVAGILARGARIEDRDTFCATSPTLLDPERIFPSPSFL
jgi:hypothetical protein